MYAIRSYYVHAGTATKDREIVSNGGRVLGVTAIGDDLKNAIDASYRAVDCIEWEGCYFRRDIGAKAMKRFQMDAKKPLVGILMGSDSDLAVMKAAA